MVEYIEWNKNTEADDLTKSLLVAPQCPQMYFFKY
jgi:hypothetical protein